MSGPEAVVIASLGLALVGVPAAARAGIAVELDAKSKLEVLAGRRVFFGHQSVGANILHGLSDVAATHGVPLRIVTLRDGARVEAGTIAERLVPENGNPLLKLRSFAQAFEAGGAADADIALVKLCYVDIRSDTDVNSLFARYQATVKELQARYFQTTFVHVTVPLQTVVVQGGAIGALKRLLGRPTMWGHLENARREEYNALVRLAYAGREPVFDLARVESTAPDGRVEQVEWQGRIIPALVPAYTDDGGHLNPEGRTRAATALLSVLASAPVRARATGSTSAR